MVLMWRAERGGGTDEAHGVLGGEGGLVRCPPSLIYVPHKDRQNLLGPCKIVHSCA